MILRYEPTSEPLHIFLNTKAYADDVGDGERQEGAGCLSISHTRTHTLTLSHTYFMDVM